MVELADTQRLGRCALLGVQVRLLLEVFLKGDRKMESVKLKDLPKGAIVCSPNISDDLLLACLESLKKFNRKRKIMINARFDSC